ncbi:MAG: class I SAM-dependent methyltransferase [Gemmatimonas sp.]
MSSHQPLRLSREACEWRSWRHSRNEIGRMTAFAQRLLARHYAHRTHPYRTFEASVDALLTRESVILDAGCGRTAPTLRKYVGRARRLIGVDLVEFRDIPADIETYRTDLASLPLGDETVDLIASQSVFEHLVDPGPVYMEMARVLRPGGAVIFLTANMWDYGTLIARIVPNRFHARIVKKVEGRDEEDTFPTAYKTNTRRDIERLAAASGLEVDTFEYLSQYPNYLMFNAALFFMGMCFEKLIHNFETLRTLRGWILVTLRKPRP